MLLLSFISKQSSFVFLMYKRHGADIGPRFGGGAREEATGKEWRRPCDEIERRASLRWWWWTPDLGLPVETQGQYVYEFGTFPFLLLWPRSSSFCYRVITWISHWVCLEIFFCECIRRIQWKMYGCYGAERSSSTTDGGDNDHEVWHSP